MTDGDSDDKQLKMAGETEVKVCMPTQPVATQEERTKVTETEEQSGFVCNNEKKENPSTITIPNVPVKLVQQYAETKDIVEDEALYKSLQQLPCYHGFLPREDLRILLRLDGDYLIRVSEVQGKKETEKGGNLGGKEIKRDLVLSVFECPGPQPSAAPANPDAESKSEMYEGKLRNMVVRRYRGKFGIEVSVSFDTIQDLLQHYHHTGDGKKNRFLKTPVPLQRWEYRHNDIKLGVLLGEGAYGEVRAGVLQRKEKFVDVAVKLMKGGAEMNKAKIREMMKEARLMRAFKHKNVVRFYGVAVQEQPLYIVLELVKGGALNTFLQKNRGKVNTTEMINMCLGAAQGLHYLHIHHCIHRDIAARNCLYSNAKVVKLSDFGLSRIGESYKISTSQKLPIKWLAAETITTLFFTFKTDVYSYGVMCFEIFTEGEEPWDNITNTEAKKSVVSGKPLPLPESCPEKIKNFLYEKVYVKDPKVRATMEELVRFFESLTQEPAENNEKSLANRHADGGIKSCYKMVQSTSLKTKRKKSNDTVVRKKQNQSARRHQNNTNDN